MKILILFLSLPLISHAQNIELDIQNAWARGTVGSQKTSAVYGEIINPSDAEKTIISATSPVAKRTELHTIQHGANGIMQMSQLAQVEIPAGGVFTLKPGGHHIMLIGLHNPLNSGNEIPITLEFDDGTTHTFRAEINPITFRPKK